MGHIINPVSFRLSKSTFWISSWNNITKKNYKMFIFEDQHLKKVINWFRRFYIWKIFNIYISDINIIRNNNKLVVNLNMGIFDYYYTNRKHKIYPNYLKRLYTDYKIKKLYNKGSKKILNNSIGSYMKYYINYWNDFLDIFKKDLRVWGRCNDLINLNKIKYIKKNKIKKYIKIKNVKEINRNSYVQDFINIKGKLALRLEEKKKKKKTKKIFFFKRKT